MENLIKEIKSFVEDKFYIEIESEEDNLVTSGLIDSMATLELISELEEKYSITFSLSDYGEENFYTLVNLSMKIKQLKE